MKILRLHTENKVCFLLLGESWLRASAVNACKLYRNIFVGFKVLTVVTIKNKFNIFWHKKPYSLFEVHQRFTGTQCFHLQDMS